MLGNKEKIARIKEEAKEELLDELTGEQRRKLEEMMGASFELKTPSLQDRIQRVRQRRQNQEGEDN